MNDRDQQSQDPAPPEKLRAALARLTARQIAVPPEVDAAVLRAARSQLRPAGKPAPQFTSWAECRARLRAWFNLRRFALAGAAAAVMVAAGLLVWPGTRPPLTAKAEDLNGDGTVDMLDAFALARELQRNPAAHPQLDFNGDGVVDERDVQTLAARAVSLGRGGHS